MNSKVILTSLLLLFSLGLPLNKAVAQGGRVETVDSKVVTDYSRLAVASSSLT